MWLACTWVADEAHLFCSGLPDVGTGIAAEGTEAYGRRRARHQPLLVQGAFDSFAMGNYPYPSSYMGGALPAWPMRAACQLLASPRLSSTQLLTASPQCPSVPAHCSLLHRAHECLTVSFCAFIMHMHAILLHSGLLTSCMSPYVYTAAHDAALVLSSLCFCLCEGGVVPVQAMAEVAGLLYNASGDVPCYNITSLIGPAGPGGTWLFQWCAQRAAQELPYFPATGQSDMFWYQGV